MQEQQARANEQEAERNPLGKWKGKLNAPLFLHQKGGQGGTGETLIAPLLSTSDLTFLGTLVKGTYLTCP